MLYFLIFHWILSHEWLPRFQSFAPYFAIVSLATSLALMEVGFLAVSQLAVGFLAVSLWFGCFVQKGPVVLSSTFRRDLFALSIHCLEAKVLVVRWPSASFAAHSLIDFSSSCWLGWMVSAVVLVYVRLASCNWHSHNRSRPAYWRSHRSVCWRRCFRVRQCLRNPAAACYPNCFPFAYRLAAVRSTCCYRRRHRRLCGHSVRSKYEIRQNFRCASRCTCIGSKISCLGFEVGVYLRSMRFRKYCAQRDRVPFQLPMQSNRKCLKFRVAYDDHHYRTFDRQTNP